MYLPLPINCSLLEPIQFLRSLKLNSSVKAEVFSTLYSWGSQLLFASKIRTGFFIFEARSSGSLSRLSAWLMSFTNTNLATSWFQGGEVFPDGAISLICTQQAEQKLHTVAANLRFHAKRTVANRLWPFSHCLLSCSSMSSRHLVPKAVDVFYFCSVIYESHDGNGAAEYRPQGDAVE